MFKEYETYDAVGLASLVRERKVSAVEVVASAIRLAETRNPAINAIVTPMYESAAESAANATGPLAGVPFLIKDLAYVEGVRCSYGSRLWADFIPDHDAEIVRRYRSAGLVIFGKTNTPEVGLAATTEPVLFGPTRNPWNLDCTTGGSSGGAAAAVAAGILPAAHATDGGGSIRIPASCCGLVGLKPTRARTPLGPDVGEGWGSMATGHVVSRSVRDSAALLDASHGPAAGDPYQAPQFDGSYRSDHVMSPGKLKIAIDLTPVNQAAVHPDCLAAVQATAQLCESLGHEVTEVNLPYERAKLAESTGILVIANVCHNVQARAALLGVKPNNKLLEAQTLYMLELGQSMSAAQYAGAINCIHQTGRQIESFLSGYDLILSPTLVCPPVKLGYMDMNGDLATYAEHFNQFWGFTNLYNATGHPAISLPLHWNADNLPVGVQFAGRLGDELLLLQLARQLEVAQPWFDRRAPLTDPD